MIEELISVLKNTNEISLEETIKIIASDYLKFKKYAFFLIKSFY